MQLNKAKYLYLLNEFSKANSTIKNTVSSIVFDFVCIKIYNTLK